MLINDITLEKDFNISLHLTCKNFSTEKEERDFSIVLNEDF